MTHTHDHAPRIEMPDSDQVLDAMIERDLGDTAGTFAEFRAWLADLATLDGVTRLQEDPGQVSLVARIVAVHRRVRTVPGDLLTALKDELVALDAERESALAVLGRWHDTLLAERARDFRSPSFGGTLHLGA